MKFTTSSGREVDLARPTIAQRRACHDLADVTYKDGGVTVKRSFSTNIAWCCVGLGVKEEQLDELSDADITEISAKVQELANLAPLAEPVSQSTSG